MGTTWGPSGADRTQVGPMLAPRTLLSGTGFELIKQGLRISTYPAWPSWRGQNIKGSSHQYRIRIIKMSLSRPSYLYKGNHRTRKDVIYIESWPSYPLNIQNNQKSTPAIDSSCGYIVEQITVRIVQIMIQATDLAQILYGGHYSRKKRGPRKISIWPPFFKMAAMGYY